MKTLRKLLNLDDDPHYSGMLALKIRQQFPELMISSCERGDVSAGYDIYVLDNDFAGEKCGAGLAEQVRTIQPDALVIVLSGTLELDLVKRLVNCHAAGVFDKSEAADLERMVTLVEQFLMKQATKPASTRRPSLKNTLSGINTLLAEWNERLALERR
jgi:DNA-binding NarL/FixJ family response regulator